MLEGAFEDRYKVDFVGAAAHRLKRPSERWMRGTQEGSVPAGSAEEIYYSRWYVSCVNIRGSGARCRIVEYAIISKPCLAYRSLSKGH